MNFLIAWALQFVQVFLRATQQRHVQHAEYMRMPLPSYGMSLCEVINTTIVVLHYQDPLMLILLAFCMGTGAWMGSMLGTYLHARRRK